MARFVLHIKNLQTGTCESRRFERSPLLVGRHPRNDLALEFPFVSQWHGSFRFDEDGRAYYVDQGSTNGSYLDGKRLASAQEREIDEGSELRIGVLRFRLEKVLAEQEPDAGPGVEPSQPGLDWRAPGLAAGAGAGRDSLPDTQPELDAPEIDAPSGDRGSSEGPDRPDRRAGAGAAAMGDSRDPGRDRGDWRLMLPRAGSAPAEDFLERLRHALELLGLIVDRQSARDAQLASALASLRRRGGDAAEVFTGAALLAYLLDPEAPVGERARELRGELER